ncbi:MAG TPA: GvpL/GvpF family gas vesicle protein [Thermoanaerobaculia bacterium]|nr:GvpL/GvpF family gas vesicle protein [Thermoanaerobaculia bacterium]
MKTVIVGVHLQREDIGTLAEVVPASGLFLSGVLVGEEQPLGDRALLLRVAEVRSRLLDRATFIAVRYGFTVRGPDEAAAKCAEPAAAWRALLQRHRDDVEMTLKAAAAAPARRPDRTEFAAGADYLRALHAAASTIDVDPSFRSAAERELVPLATRFRWLRETTALELALLVPRGRVEDVNAAGERLRKAFASVPFLLSGPWPLEVFTHDDHE